LIRLCDTPFSDARFTFVNEKEIFIKKQSILNTKEVNKTILEEDYTIMRDIYQNQPIKITSNGNVKI